MERKKVFITIAHLRFGGIQKSLVTFLEYLVTFTDIDLLIWDEVIELEVPKGVNVIKIPTVKSVKYSTRKDGIFSKNTFISVLGSLCDKRWKVMKKIKKEYDVAIAYTNGGFGKYFVIDKVNAKKKYTFFHNGAYVEDNKFKAWDMEYYPKYDNVFAVSKHIENMLREELGDNINFSVLANLTNVESILDKGNESCEIMDSYDGLKILTVGRLSEEKNPLFILDVAKCLKEKNINFKWFVVGDGPLKDQIELECLNNNFNDNVILCGGQSNPYKFMKRTDVYTQFSVYEAEPVVVKEVSLFGKPMILSNIEGFYSTEKMFDKVCLVDNDAMLTANKILEYKDYKDIRSDLLIKFNENVKEQILLLFERK